MAKKSTKHAESSDAIDRPFDPAVLENAKAIAWKYQIVLEPHEDCGYIGSALELPTVYSDAKTADECVAVVREALTAAVAYLIESGKTPPAPAKDQVRNKQLNIRVTETEQRRMKAAAKARGCSDVSEYVRTLITRNL